MAHLTLYILNPTRYFGQVLDIFKKFGKNQTVIYVTINKPYEHLINLFTKEGISCKNILFVDCISKEVAMKDKKNTENCIFVGSPQDITSICMAISRCTKMLPGKKVLILDSLSTLLLYNDAEIIGRFSNFILNKMRQLDVSAIMLTLETDAEKDVIRTISSFVDEVKKIDN